MPRDDRPGEARRLERARIDRGFETAKAACRFFGWNYDTYIQHERGERGITKTAAAKYAKAFNVTAAYLLTGQGDRHGAIVPIMGYIGAGEEIEPEYEQVPEDGLEQVELPFPVPEEMIGFEVRGDSMAPAYRAGDVVIVSRSQTTATDHLIGEEATVRTEDGRRFLKRISLGPRRGRYNLESLNGRYSTIVGVAIAWANVARIVVRASQIRRIERINGTRPSRAGTRLDK